MTTAEHDDRSHDAEAGLCARCRHVAVQTTARGSRFYRCRRAETDERYARYPPLPVRACSGWTPRRGCA